MQLVWLCDENSVDKTGMDVLVIAEQGLQSQGLSAHHTSE